MDMQNGYNGRKKNLIFECEPFKVGGNKKVVDFTDVSEVEVFESFL